MKHQTRKILDSTIAILNGIVDEPQAGSQDQILGSNQPGRTPLDLVNEVLAPFTEGYYIVAAVNGGKVDGFCASRKPREVQVAEPVVPDEPTE